MSEKRDSTVAADKALMAYERMAEVAGSFADPVRLEIIEALAQTPRTVESLARICGLPVKNISHHLQKLRTAGFVNRIRLGRRSIYSLASQEIAAFWSCLRAFAEAYPPSIPAPARRSENRGITADDLAELLRQDRVTVVDVRPPEEFAASHLPGALSIPIAELEVRLEELPRNKPVVAFCRGPYCRLADRAVDLLRHSDFEALRCADGVIEWRDNGHSLQPPHSSQEIEK